MATKTVSVSDISGEEIPEGTGAKIRVMFSDQRRGVREIDVTDSEAQDFAQHGRSVARRGRRPKNAAAEPAAEKKGVLAEKVGTRSGSKS